MPSHEDYADNRPSTTWQLKHVKMRRQPNQYSAERSEAPLPALRQRDARKRLTISIEYSGGSESWWIVRARGREYRFTGILCLEDMMYQLNRARG